MKAFDAGLVLLLECVCKTFLGTLSMSSSNSPHSYVDEAVDGAEQHEDARRHAGQMLEQGK